LMKVFVINDEMNEVFQEDRLNDIDKDIDLINTFLKICYFSRIFLTD
jgi:tetrahydromethanopterin S-methyltransferase subunit G